MRGRKCSFSRANLAENEFSKEIFSCGKPLCYTFDERTMHRDMDFLLGLMDCLRLFFRMDFCQSDISGQAKPVWHMKRRRKKPAGVLGFSGANERLQL
jgi:hypothetical protein